MHCPVLLEGDARGGGPVCTKDGGREGAVTQDSQASKECLFPQDVNSDGLAASACPLDAAWNALQIIVGSCLHGLRAKQFIRWLKIWLRQNSVLSLFHFPKFTWLVTRSQEIPAYELAFNVHCSLKVRNSGL